METKTEMKKKTDGLSKELVKKVNDKQWMKKAQERHDKETKEIEAKALAVWDTCLKECGDPEQFWKELVQKWLESSEHAEQRKILGLLAWGMIKHSDDVTPDWAELDLPSEMNEQKIQFFYDILRHGGMPARVLEPVDPEEAKKSRVFRAKFFIC